MISRRLVVLWLPVVLYMTFIFTLSSISQPPDLPVGTDKEAHGVLYAGLGVLLVRALAGGVRTPVTLRIAIAAIGIAALYGVSDEFHQWFVPPRQVEVLDVVADTVGAAVASVLLCAWSMYRSRRRV